MAEYVRVACCAILLVGCARSHELDLASDATGAGRVSGDGGPSRFSDAGSDGPSRDASPGDAGADAFVPVDESLRYAERRCAWLARCSSWTIDAAWLRGEASCVHAERRRVDEIVGRGHAPPVATWCDAPEVDADCDGVDDVTSCDPRPGRLPEDGACVTDRECGLSPSARPMGCVGCRCRAWGRAGEACDDARPCGPSLRCDPREGICRAQTILADGARCARDSSVVCRAGSTCHEGVCTRSPRVGERCEPTGPACFSGGGTSRCAAGADGVPRCQSAFVFVAAGEPCERGEVCAGGSFCTSDGVCPATCADDPRTCGLSACDETFDDCLLPPLRCPGS
ncbi:MAG: hypothetical protein KF901_04755 [Myxococcales bacterium]|nr:hypothetical protein [Myxococcales bacterium]